MGRGKRQEGITAEGRDRGRREGTKGEKRWKRVGEERKQKSRSCVQRQCTPGDAKCITEILGGTKIRKLGANFKFGQLILRKIIKIVAARSHILRL